MAKQPTSPKPKPQAKKKGGEPATQARTISENRKAKHRYEIMEQLECGIVLLGSEVKSLRDGKVSLDEAYARFKGQELLLVSCDIAEYSKASIWNHEPKRPRRLLVHKRQLQKLMGRANERGLTLIPLRLNFNERGIVKVQLGVCKGKKIHDKRETLKKADTKREIDRAMRRK
jgi:SsrA-binding protein